MKKIKDTKVVEKKILANKLEWITLFIAVLMIFSAAGFVYLTNEDVVSNEITSEYQKVVIPVNKSVKEENIDIDKEVKNLESDQTANDDDLSEDLLNDSNLAL